jgi:hypothetical protein
MCFRGPIAQRMLVAYRRHFALQRAAGSRPIRRGWSCDRQIGIGRRGAIRKSRLGC